MELVLPTPWVFWGERKTHSIPQAEVMNPNRCDPLSCTQNCSELGMKRRLPLTPAVAGQVSDHLLVALHRGAARGEPLACGRPHSRVL